MSTLRAFHAAARFGLGAAPGELFEIQSDPQGWIIQQLDNPIVPPLIAKDYGGNAILVKRFGVDRNPEFDKKQKRAERKALNKLTRETYAEELAARMLGQASAHQPFTERMVLFWSNHFTISKRVKQLAPIVNSYEKEAIRPHLNGYFSDMLLAVERHPAMLQYLDNHISMGPNSKLAERHKGRGLNENLAREIMELHTLGVGGGYTQDDVIELAKIITGWGIPGGQITGDKLTFHYEGRRHEPGNKLLLGQQFKEGEAEGIRALKMLANHPATARFISTKLARHFIADNPPEHAVAHLTKVYLNSKGHLPTVLRALVQLDEAWNQPLVKLKNHYEYILSAVRLTKPEMDARQAYRFINAVNSPRFDATSPAGYDDVAEAWASPDAIMKRIELAQILARRLPAATDPMVLAQKGLGDALSENTKQVIAQAETGKDGVLLMLASPEFQRR